MKRKRFTEEQIIMVLSEHEAGAKVGDVTRERVESGDTLNCPDFFKRSPIVLRATVPS